MDMLVRNRCCILHFINVNCLNCDFPHHNNSLSLLNKIFVKFFKYKFELYNSYNKTETPEPFD